MPKGPRGEKRPADVIGAAIVGRGSSPGLTADSHCAEPASIFPACCRAGIWPKTSPDPSPPKMAARSARSARPLPTYGLSRRSASCASAGRLRPISSSSRRPRAKSLPGSTSPCSMMPSSTLPQGGAGDLNSRELAQNVKWRTPRRSCGERPAERRSDSGRLQEPGEVITSRRASACSTGAQFEILADGKRQELTPTIRVELSRGGHGG